jgi:hypothetical protein
MKMNPRAVPIVAVVGVALVSVGWTCPGVVSDCGLDFWNVPELQAHIDQNLQQAEDWDAEDRQVLQRIEIKEKLITQLIDGRTTIPEVAAQFKQLNAGREDYLALFRKQYPGASDDECYCRNVLAFAESRLHRDGPRGRERTERLRQQLDRLLQSRGPFVLRDVMLTDVEPLAAGQ